MAFLEEVREERLKKIALMKERGMDPYPAETNRTLDNGTFLATYDRLLEEKTAVTLAGRVLSLRAQGGIAFADLFDGVSRVQALLKKDALGDEFDFFLSVVDTGDFMEIAGTPFTTNRGMNSLQASSWKMLAKSLRPIPDEWYGLKDEDERYRKRYLDMLLSPHTRELFVKKAKFWQSVRGFLVAEGFLEVETPALETTTGGADARPFKTHHHALDMDVYLRISAGELWQKRLMVAGYPKVFEIGRIFRNEGMSAEHLQDYTQMEFYWGYADYERGMELVERLYKHVAMETFGTLTFKIGEFDVDLGASWKRYDYRETIKEFTSIDIDQATLAEIEMKLSELGITYSKEGWNESRAMDLLWKHCRKQIGGPGFLVGVPKALSPLAKTAPANPRVVERFQPLIAGSELGNGYSELNDPVDQKERFEEQQRLRDAGDEEAQMADYDYVEALEYGMPPTCGYGMSERVFAFLANVSVREAQTFPLMRPKNDHD
jgi:lysyl-tRNA synthetase, class II